jgi:tetratricopeptide (TPR) repeat protein
MPRARRMRWRSTVAATLLTLAPAVSSCTSDSDETPEATGEATATAESDAATAQVDTLLEKGIAQAQAGDLDAARVTFDNVLSLDPGNKYALFNLGIIEQSRKKRAAALDYYDAALESDPEYTPAMYNKAILVERADLEEAVGIYEAILEIDPEASTTYLRLSFAYEELGQQEKADTMRQKAVELDPSLADVTAAPDGD